MALLTTEAERERATLTEAILGKDRRIYEAITVGAIDEWLRVELTMRQLKLLLLLVTSEGQGARMGQLAGALGVTLPTITGIVDRLVEHRLVQREEDPSDRRLVMARLTAEGQVLLERLQHGGRRQMAATLERLSLEDLRLVARALDLLVGAALSGRPSAAAPAAELPTVPPVERR